MACQSTGLGSDLQNATFPLEVHIFERDAQHYAFDVRNYSILKLSKNAAAVLRRMRGLPLEQLIEDLAQEMTREEVCAHYVKFLKLVQEGILSIQPIEMPGRPNFNHLVIMLAGGCNMGCTYCFEKNVPIYQNPNLMTRDRADEVVDWFCRHQEGEWAHVQLYGGEALLNWPILQYVVERLEHWAAENGKRLTKYLITNGTLLNLERIAYLKAHHVEVQVSVDGDAETHDHFRVLKSGKPTLDRIKPHIEELARQGADYNLRAVMTRRNLDPVAVIEALRSLGTDEVSFEVVATDYEPAQLSDQDWATFNVNYRKYVNGELSEWSHLPHEMQSTILNICQHRTIFYGCGAGVSEVTVGPDGSIYECQRIYRKPYSHVSEDKSPVELDSKLLTMVDNRPVCKDCWARYLCGGGCMHQSHTNNTDDPIPQYCESKRDLVESSIINIDRVRSLQAGWGDFPTVIWENV